MKRIAFFISGTGGNALNLLRACGEGRVSAEPVFAIASTPKAAGIARLRAKGLSVEVLERKHFNTDEDFSEACYALVEAAGADIICLTGWLKKLVIPGRWEERILNIHPALLPQFGGSGMYGIKVHQAVLEAGAKESGCTVHIVDNRYDHGPILAQAKVPVLAGDTPETLQQRVYAMEMELYPRALQLFIKNK